MLCLCLLSVWIMCVDGRSRYLYIVLGGYLRIVGSPSVLDTVVISMIYHQLHGYLHYVMFINV